MHFSPFSNKNAIKLIFYWFRIKYDFFFFFPFSFLTSTCHKLKSELKGCMPAYLVFHIHDKRVCGLETSQCIADPRIILLRYIHWMRIERVQRASAQFEDLNGCLGPCLGPQAVSACLLSQLFAFSKTAHGKKLGYQSSSKCYSMCRRLAIDD